MCVSECVSVCNVINVYTWARECECVCVVLCCLCVCVNPNSYIIAHIYKVQYLFSNQPDILLSKYIHHFLLIMLIAT